LPSLRVTWNASSKNSGSLGLLSGLDRNLYTFS
jgi:hypothetical protein